jgi:hypothetical protein
MSPFPYQIKKYVAHAESFFRIFFIFHTRGLQLKKLSPVIRSLPMKKVPKKNTDAIMTDESYFFLIFAEKV